MIKTQPWNYLKSQVKAIKTKILEEHRGMNDTDMEAALESLLDMKAIEQQLMRCFVHELKHGKELEQGP